MEERKKEVLRVYNRKTVKGQYPNGLAYSVHLSVKENEEECPLHNNYGLVFPKAWVNEDNVIVPSFVGNLKVAAVKKDGAVTYLITGEDWKSDGSVNSENKGSFGSWSTADFLTFEEWGICSGAQLCEKTGLTLEAIRMTDQIAIPDEMAQCIKHHWNALHAKRQMTEPKLKFPLARGLADPVVLLWKDDYYFIATNDNENDIGFYVRKAHELEDLFAKDVKTYKILDKDTENGFVQLFWAPEFHVLNGSLYLLFTVSDSEWNPQCHIMKLKENGDILNPKDWEKPIRVRRANGGFLSEKGINIDMTPVKSGERYFYVWSHRKNIGTPLDTGSMLMIAEFDPVHPERLISEPKCLSRPLYGFENTEHTINNEGPYAFYYHNKIYLAYSGGDARGYLYAIGMLTANDGDDLCDLSVWEKAKTPIASFATIPGEYGPGHNSFFWDRDQNLWIAYHAVTSFEEKIVSSGMRRVYFEQDKTPRFDVIVE